jgi:hypothetical protein
MMRRFLAVTVGILLLVGCTDNHKVGTGVDTTKHKGGNLALGQDTTTIAPPVTLIAPPSAPPTTHPRPTAPPQTTPRTTPTTAPAGSFQVITINPDNGSVTQFSPSASSVYAGTAVHWQNKDAKPRSVVEDNGAFRSPLIPPGGEWVYMANTPGNYNYQDGTRPYAVGSLAVLSQ